MADEATMAMAEAVARRSTTDVLGEYGQYVYEDEPTTTYTPSVYRASALPVNEYEQQGYSVPIGDTGWDIPGIKEVARGFPEGGPVLEQFSRRTIYPDTPMAQPQGDAIPVDGGFDFGGTMLPQQEPQWGHSTIDSTSDQVAPG